MRKIKYRFAHVLLAMLLTPILWGADEKLTPEEAKLKKAFDSYTAKRNGNFIIQGEVVDENGNNIELVYYDQDDEPLAGMSVPVTQMVYDERGLLMERKNMDINRNLINHPRSGVSVLKYAYDESGHPSDTLRFNSDMTAI